MTSFTGINRASYTAGHFELIMDGHVSTAYLKSVDGGNEKVPVIDERVGPSPVSFKHHAPVPEITPFTIDFGMSGANDVLKWIQDSWNKKYGRRSGSVNHGNFNLQITREHEFLDALITETSFPVLDGASKDAGYMKIKVQPELVKIKDIKNGPRMTSKAGAKQKLWTPSAFRFSIDGVDGLEYSNKIEAFTIKQGVKKLYTGERDLPQIEPTKIEFPDIVGTIATEYAGKLREWYQQRGKKNALRTGSLEFLSPGRDRTLFRINFDQIGLKSLEMVPSQANQDAIKRLKFEIFVGEMKMDGAGQLGMEAS